MATQHHICTTNPTQVFGLLEGRLYSLQNTGPGRDIILAQAPTKPLVDSRSIQVLEQSQYAIIRLLTSEVLWSWVRGGESVLSWDLAP